MQDFRAESSGGENTGADGYIDSAGKAYVHEAFLADWTPSTSSGHPCSNFIRNPQGVMPQEAHREQLSNYKFGEVPQPQTSNMQQFPSLSKNPQHPSFLTGVGQSGSRTTKLNNSVSWMTSNTSKSQYYFQPYRARRPNGAHLVKLAPDLPPVNLPPTVRVVPQSAFKGALSGASQVVSAAGGGIGDAGTQNIVSQIPHDGRCRITPGQERSSGPKDGITSSHTQESRVVKDKYVEEERNTDSGLQMHPLLFHTPEDGRLPYYPLNSSTSNSSSFSFLTGSQPQLNLSLLHNPHQENHVGYFSKSLMSFTSASRGIDFHPLLQRTDYVNSDSVSACSTAQVSVGSGDKSSQLRRPFDAVQTKSLVNKDQLARDLHPSSDEKGKELDLEIQLSSTSKKEKARGKDVTRNPVKSTVTAPAMFVPSNNIGRYVDDRGDQSHPEIVMEQEELSDSDEENEENVEFEREEMADSEGEEGSGCEQSAEMQAKVTSYFLFASIVICYEKHAIHLLRINILVNATNFIEVSL